MGIVVVGGVEGGMLEAPADIQRTEGSAGRAGRRRGRESQTLGRDASGPVGEGESREDRACLGERSECATWPWEWRGGDGG